MLQAVLGSHYIKKTLIIASDKYFGDVGSLLDERFAGKDSPDAACLVSEAYVVTRMRKPNEKKGPKLYEVR